MAKLISVTCSTVAAAIAGFDAPVDDSSVTYAYRWELAPVLAGLESSVVYAIPRAGSALVDVKFSPPLSPGQAYTLTATDATAGGVALAALDKALSFNAPGASLTVPPEYKVLENISWSLAEEMASLSGRPETQTVEEFPEGADVLAVETTLRYPSTGRIWIDGRAATYTSRVGSSFRGVVLEAPSDGVPIPERSWVSLDLSSVPT